MRKKCVVIILLLIIISLLFILYLLCRAKELFSNNTKIENIAILIPIYPPHYHYIYDLIEKLIKNNINIDIILVFSNESDYELFQKKKQKIKIVLQNEVDISKLRLDTTDFSERQQVTSYKKFYGLDKLKNDNKYDYIISCDSEIDIVPQNFNINNINNKISQIFENKLIYAGYTDDSNANNITKFNIENNIFNSNEIDKLQKYTKNYKLYYWWSDLPVYKRSNLSNFLNKIKFNASEPITTIFDFYYFEFLLYLNYLILYENFKFINITSLIGLDFSLERLSTENLNQLNILKDNKYGFSYVNHNIFNKQRTYFIQEGTFLIYHIDRE